MHIWLMQTGEIHSFETGARKMRTDILADYLRTRGHSIVWWSTNFSHQKKAVLSRGCEEVSIDKDYKIKFIKGFPYSKNVGLRRYIHHKLQGQLFSPTHHKQHL